MGEKACGGGKSKCTGPMAGMCTAGLKNKEASVAGLEGGRAEESMKTRNGRSNQGPVTEGGRSLARESGFDSKSDERLLEG